MRYTIKIDGRSYQVEIDDLAARPVIARVDGEAIEIWPDAPAVEVIPPANDALPIRTPVAAQPARPVSTPPRPAAPAAAQPSTGGGKVIHAPIPGVIVEIKVQPGSTVAVGDEVCVLEAMKMKNSIRSARAGEIAAVHVSVGQLVKHNDILMEFAEA